MKLIIEIPEEQYNDIVKYLTNNDGNYAYSDFNLREIIRNGTPYNPSGDAISREALKKCAIPCQIHNGALTELCVPLYQIDNALTVSDRYDEGYAQGYVDGSTGADWRGGTE